METGWRHLENMGLKNRTKSLCCHLSELLTGPAQWTGTQEGDALRSFCGPGSFLTWVECVLGGQVLQKHHQAVTAIAPTPSSHW